MPSIHEVRLHERTAVRVPRSGRVQHPDQPSAVPGLCCRSRGAVARCAVRCELDARLVPATRAPRGGGVLQSHHAASTSRHDRRDRPRRRGRGDRAVLPDLPADDRAVRGRVRRGELRARSRVCVGRERGRDADPDRARATRRADRLLLQRSRVQRRHRTVRRDLGHRSVERLWTHEGRGRAAHARATEHRDRAEWSVDPRSARTGSSSSGAIAALLIRATSSSPRCTAIPWPSPCRRSCQPTWRRSCAEPDPYPQRTTVRVGDGSGAVVGRSRSWLARNASCLRG